MRYSLLPDPARINPGFLKRDRVNGLGQPTDTPASGSPSGSNGSSTPGFWDTLGSDFLGIFRQTAPGLVNWGITGNPPQSVITPQGQVTTIPGGTKTLASATAGSGAMPSWLIPALIGGAALLFFAAKKK